MIYMIQINYDPTAPAPPNSPSRQPEHARLTEQLRAEGKYRGGAGLAPLVDGARAMVRGGQLITDGPFAETKEALGGFFVVECADLAEALEIARCIAVSEGSWTEVRRVGIWMPE